MSKIAIMMADGCEEIEALTVVDLLRRAGYTADMIAVGEEKTVTGSHGIAFAADLLFGEADQSSYDGVVLPGGMPGTTNLKAHEGLMKWVKDFADTGKLVAAICAAPALIFGDLGFVDGYEATCYPGMEEHLKGAHVRTDLPAVSDRNRITSRGLGTAVSFALEIVRYFSGDEKAEELKKSVVAD